MDGTKNSTVRCAVIGYGGAFNMGRHHAEQMIAAGMEFVAACDVDAARVEAAATDFPGIRTYTNFEALLKDDGVDLAVIILPHNLHAEVAVKAAGAGKHVVVEKPMSVTVAEADAMVEAAKMHGTMLSIFHNRRWDGDFMTIRELIAEDLIGDVFKIEAALGGYHKPGTWWRSNKAVNGTVMHDWGAHILDWIFHIIPDEMTGVDGYFHKRVWHEATVEDHGEIVVRFKGGKTAQVEQSMIAAAGKPRWRILGTKGSIVMPSWDNVEVTVDHHGHLAHFDVKPKPSTPQEYYNNIAAHLMKGEELVVKPEQSRRIIAAIEAGEASSNEGHTVAPKYV